MNNPKLDSKTISIWKYHLQDEIDAAFLYRILSGLTRSEKKKKIYSQLADVEDKHVSAWKELLLKNMLRFRKMNQLSKQK